MRTRSRCIAARTHCIVLPALLALLACDVAPDNPYDPDAPAGLKPRGSIAGQILLSDATDRSAVSVRLLENGRSTLTGVDGSFLVRDLESGPYTVELSKEGYRTETRFAVIRLGNDVVLDQVTLLDTQAPAPPTIAESSLVLNLQTECDDDPARLGQCTASVTLTVEGAPYVYAQICDAADPSTTFTADSDGPFAFEVRGGVDFSVWTRVCYDDGIAFQVAENLESRLRVRKVDPEGNASADDFVLVTEDSDPPEAPTISNVIEGRDRARIFWSDSPSDDVVAYRVHYGAASGSLDGTFAAEGDSPIDVGPATEFTLSGLNPGSNVFVAVTAVDGVGLEGPTSAAVIALPNPVTPEPAGTLQLEDAGPQGEILDLELCDELALLARGQYGLELVDLADVSSPVSLGRLAAAAPAAAVAKVTGGYAVVAARSAGIHVINLRDPTMPAVVVSLAAADLGLATVDVVDVAVDGRYALLANAESGGDDGLIIVDILDPHRPARVGALDLPSAPAGVVGSGDLAFAVVPTSGIPVRIVDVSDPAAPVLRAGISASDLATRPSKVVVSGSRLLAINDAAGLTLVDLDRGKLLDPVHDCDAGDCTTVRGLFDTPGSVEDAVIAAGMIAVLDKSHGLLAASAADPDNPGLLGLTALDGVARHVALLGSFAVAALEGAYLQVVELAAPRSPTPGASTTTSGSAEALRVVSQCALVATGDSGLTAVDLSDISVPTISASLPDIGKVRDLVVDGSLAYAVIRSEGLVTLDISDPCQPAKLDLWQPGGYLGGLALLPGKLALAAVQHRERGANTFPGRLVVLDLADPTSISELTAAGVEDLGREAGTQAHLGHTVVTGDRAWVVERRLNDADEIHGLEVSDISVLLSDPGACRQDPVSCKPGALTRVQGITAEFPNFVTRIDRRFMALWDLVDPETDNGRLLIMPADLDPTAGDVTVAELDADTGLSALQANGPYLYAAGGREGVLIFDRAPFVETPQACIANGCALNLTARLALEDDVESLVVAGPWAVVAEARAGLRIVDLE